MKIEHVSLLHIKDKRILLVLAKGKDIWQAPGGKVEKGESDEEALARECSEELSVNIKPETIKFFRTLKGKAHSMVEDIDIEIRIYTAEFEGEVSPKAEIVKASYFTYDELPKLTKIGLDFRKTLKADGLID